MLIINFILTIFLSLPGLSSLLGPLSCWHLLSKLESEVWYEILVVEVAAVVAVATTKNNNKNNNNNNNIDGQPNSKKGPP